MNKYTFKMSSFIKKIVIIIQARLNSKRLPNKVLKKINNTTILEHIIFRLKKLNIPLVVATTTIRHSVATLAREPGVGTGRGNRASSSSSDDASEQQMDGESGFLV